MTEKLSDEVVEKIRNFDANYADIRSRLSAACKEAGASTDSMILLAATKTVPAEVINHAMDSGIEYIGENRVQELLSKKKDLKATAHRHFIGHLQTNKVKDIINEVEMIESVHSVKLAAEIEKCAAKAGKTMDVLLEVNIGGEQSKSGFTPDEAENAVAEISKMPHLRVKGLMTIPPVCESTKKQIEYFTKMHKLFIDIRDKNMDNVNILYLSMGMSDDFELAVKCGANIVRIGTALFGKRNYM